MDNTDEIIWTITIGTLISCFLLNTSRLLQASELCQECLIILKNAAHEKKVELAYTAINRVLFKAYLLLNDHKSAIECGTKLLDCLSGLGLRAQEGELIFQIANLYQLQSKFKDAKGLYSKALRIFIETDNRNEEATCYGNLGTLSKSLGEYGKAEEYQRKGLAIRQEIGDKHGEATCYLNLGTVCHSMGKYKKAEEHLKNALLIMKELGDKAGEATCSGNLGTVYHSLGEYKKAEEHQNNALVITKEIGDKKREAVCYGNLGTVYESLGEYGKAEEDQRKSLAISQEIGDKHGVAECYRNLGTLCLSLGEYKKAEEHLNNALAITKVIGDKLGEAVTYANLGSMCHSVGEYKKAEEHLNNALVITKEIGEKRGEAACYGNQGNVFRSLGKYAKAEEYQTKALAISQEIHDKHSEATSYGNLGTVCISLGEYRKADEHLNNALVILKEIGDKRGEAACYVNLGSMSESFGEFGKAEEYQRKALAIRQEIGDKRGVATCYGHLGIVCHFLGEYEKAEEHLSNALVTKKEIGDKEGEAACYGLLGNLFRSLGKQPEAKQHHEKALAISRAISDINAEAEWHLQLAYDAISEGNVRVQHEIFSNLSASINKCEKMRSFLGHNDQFKISLFESRSYSYHLLSTMLCESGKETEGICVLELGRARALGDLISGQHSAQQEVTVTQPSWADIERIVKKQSNCSCLYISYFQQYVFLLVLKVNKPLHFRKINVNECFVTKGLKRDVHQVFREDGFRRFKVLPHEHCEDRSMSFSTASDSTHEQAKQESLAVYRLVEDDEEENLQPDPSLAEQYKMIIAPVVDFLVEPELMIVPDRALYKVPFAALMDKRGNYLSDAYRIRIVPSLTTLGIIQDTPADYHSRTGALIVGEPDVRDVYYKGYLGILSSLPCAREEAEMIGKLIGAEPLLGKQATKEAVLQNIHSASLIHFAAHGNAERGEIALAPQSSTNGTPSEKDYLLTMADISQVQVRAKLVVLSCCHSAQGKVRAEGVVGIARAFLGSGARSVLVALWAIPDEATKELMSRFYEHLVRGESASESLHQAMKWMRNNGYSDVRDWAPFILIGDNVTFDFEK